MEGSHKPKPWAAVAAAAGTGGGGRHHRRDVCTAAAQEPAAATAGRLHSMQVLGSSLEQECAGRGCCVTHCFLGISRIFRLTLFTALHTFVSY